MFGNLVGSGTLTQQRTHTHEQYGNTITAKPTDRQNRCSYTMCVIFIHSGVLLLIQHRIDYNILFQFLHLLTDCPAKICTTCSGMWCVSYILSVCRMDIVSKRWVPAERTCTVRYCVVQLRGNRSTRRPTVFGNVAHKSQWESNRWPRSIVCRTNRNAHRHRIKLKMRQTNGK